MELELTICKAAEVVDLVKSHERDNIPFGIVISIEHPCDESVSLEQGRAPRLAKEIGTEWTDRQIILTCHDIETSLMGTPAPEPALVQSALDHFEKWRPNGDAMRVLVHCRSGKARSTALGLVLLRYHRGPGTEKECLEELLRLRPLAAPNIAIVQHGDALLGCAGALVQVVESDRAVTSRRAEANFAYLGRAGQQASARGALKEAELYFKHAIAVLSATPDTPERAQREFSLQLALIGSLVFTSGSATKETMLAVNRLRELGEVGNPEQLIFALIGAWAPTVARGDMALAQQFADQMLEIAERSGSKASLSMAHIFQGNSRLMVGELTRAMHHFEAAIASYNETDFAETFIDSHGWALQGIGRVLWHWGKADEGRAKTRESISLSERLKKNAMIADSLLSACGFYMELREPANVQEAAERLFTLASQQQLSYYSAGASVCRGWAMAQQGRTGEGIAMIRDGLDSSVARGERMITPLIALSDAQALAGQLNEALETIKQVFSAAGKQQINLPRVLWRRGELHLRRGDETEAADDFREAIAVARHIGSKAYELRATTSLARQLAKQGKRDEARSILAEIYNWFTEGFDTADLKDAKALLDELSV